MKILHMADTHLGYSAYRKLTKDGKNQRELDIYNAFKCCIDNAIKARPDLILHAGDLFDSVRPTNRAITIALDQIIRLSKEGIPFIVISGNHETPKLKETGSIFKIFEHIDYVYPIYDNRYEKIPFNIKNKEIIIHAVPHCHTKQVFLDNLNKIKSVRSADINICITHGAVSGIKEFKMNEFNELFVPTKILSGDFHYIALGHYHKYTKIAKNAYYSGSPERFSFAEVGDKKGYMEIEIGRENKYKFIEIDTRPMIDSNPINCLDLSIEEITHKIQKIIKKIKPEGKIFRIKLENIPSHIYRSIDFNNIRKQCNGAVHFEIKSNIVKEGDQRISENYIIESISSEFKKYINNQEIIYKDFLLKLGLDYIQKVESKDEGK